MRFSNYYPNKRSFCFNILFNTLEQGALKTLNIKTGKRGKKNKEGINLKPQP